MNTRTCTHTNTRVHVLTSIEAERGRERNKIKEKKKHGRKRKGERGRGGKRMQRHNLPWLAMERSIRQRQQHFFEFRRPGPSMIAPSTHTHIHTHWRNVFPGSRFVVEVAAPSAGRKKDNGRKEWGSISWFLRGVLKCRLPVLAAHHGVYMRRVFR